MVGGEQVTWPQYSPLIGCRQDHIECAKLVDFLNDKQRDPRLNEILYPHYNEARVMEIVTRYQNLSTYLNIYASTTMYLIINNIYSYETDPELINKKSIGKEGFTRYLMSDENSPVFLDRLDIYQVL